MHANTGALWKNRIIQFCQFHPDPDQAASAAHWLQGVAGVQTVEPLSPHSLAVSYDLRAISLERIENALDALGYHLDNSLLCKLKRALFYYAEATQRENLAITQEGEVVQREVFINRYQKATHGCRDPQPEYWREYQ